MAEREECRLWEIRMSSSEPATEFRPGEEDGQGQRGMSQNLTKLLSCYSRAPQAPFPWARISPGAWVGLSLPTRGVLGSVRSQV